MLTGDDVLGLADGLGFANDENGLGVLENAGDGRQRLVGRVDL